MASIRSSGTKPELMLKPFLESLGFRYLGKNYWGTPDYVNEKRMAMVFVDGCFWHCCPEHFKMPMNNREVWEDKFSCNKERDKRVNKHYLDRGWVIVRIWEHELKSIILVKWKIRGLLWAD